MMSGRVVEPERELPYISGNQLLQDRGGGAHSNWNNNILMARKILYGRPS